MRSPLSTNCGTVRATIAASQGSKGFKARRSNDRGGRDKLGFDVSEVCQGFLAGAVAEVVDRVTVGVTVLVDRATVGNDDGTVVVERATDGGGTGLTCSDDCAGL